MLLDCWAIPCVMLFTWIFLKTKYKIGKFFGVFICVAGLVLVIFSDVHAADRSSGSNPIKGDILVISGATLYALCNVSEEFFVKSADRVELMAFLGLFGAIISACQIRSRVPVLLKISGSTMLNLSLLTSDMWSVFIRIFAYHEKVDWMYYVAFAAVVVGLIVYSGADKAAEVADEGVVQSKRFDEEAGSDNLTQKDATGASSKHDFASTSSRETFGVRSGLDIRNETEGGKC